VRVIGGTAKGTKLLAVPGDTTRPILDRVKTSLFDIIRHSVPESRWLDVFAGSGGVGIEALSLGAEHVTFIDLSQEATNTVRKNLEKTHLLSRAEIRTMDCFRYLRNTSKSFDFIFIAPPQYKGLWLEALQEVSSRPNLLKCKGKVIVQIDPKEDDQSVHFPSLSVSDTRKYGNTQLIFYTKEASN
jgi:16S rRNA (guanine966-N2)-methyltransferase